MTIWEAHVITCESRDVTLINMHIQPNDLCPLLHCSRYKVVGYPLSKLVKATPTNCVQILMQAGLKDWALGKTKVCDHSARQ